VRGADDRDRRPGPIQAILLRLLEVPGWEVGRLSAGDLMPEALEALSEIVDRIHALVWRSS
jgi:hypothetical protein